MPRSTLLWASLLLPWIHAMPTKLLWFGDSLSDNGKPDPLSLYNSEAIGNLPIPPSEAEGGPYSGGRFADGLVFPDYLCEDHLQVEPADCHNFAIGGAVLTADPDPASVRSTLKQQVDALYTFYPPGNNTPFALSDTLLIGVLMGSNDLLRELGESIGGGERGPAEVAASLTTELLAQVQRIEDWAEATAAESFSIVVMTPPDPALAPRVRDLFLDSLPELSATLLEAFTAQVDMSFQSVDSVQVVHMSKSIPIAHLECIVAADSAGPPCLELGPVGEASMPGSGTATQIYACLTELEDSDSADTSVCFEECKDPSSVFWFDELHPTSIVHQGVAAQLWFLLGMTNEQPGMDCAMAELDEPVTGTRRVPPANE
ncbi:unnamed protein product, partial [Chrysoparadoxa australica]